MSRNRRKKNTKAQNQNGSSKSTASGKKVEVNVNDADVNTADLRPMERKSGSKTGDNDYTWYNHYAKQFDTVSGFQYGKPLGSGIGYAFSSDLTLGGSKVNHNYTLKTVPGIMTLHYIPTFGAAPGGTYASPLNKVSDQIYQVMRMLLGSRANYDETDTALYLIAMDSAFMLYSLGMKIYGSLRMSSPQNYYFMRALCASMNVDFNSFADNMADFRNLLNQYAIYLSTYSVPADFDIYKRHAWLLQNLFVDSETPKAQMYHYMPDGYYVYKEVTNGPAYCQFNPMLTAQVGSTGQMAITFQSLKTMMYECLNALQTSQDVAEMSADINKAFAGKVYQLELTPEDFYVPIRSSKEVLSQIENTILYGKAQSVEYKKGTTTEETYLSWNIYQSVDLAESNGPVLMQLATTSPLLVNSSIPDTAIYQYSRQNFIVNMHKAEVTKEDNFVATRGICTSHVESYFLESDPASVACVTLDSYGSEVFTFAAMFHIDNDGDSTSFNGVVETDYCTVSVPTPFQLLSEWNTFDWAPVIEAVSSTVDTTNKVVNLTVRRYQDFDYFALVDATQVEAMNTTAVLSMFWSDKFPVVQ